MKVCQDISSLEIAVFANIQMNSGDLWLRLLSKLKCFCVFISLALETVTVSSKLTTSAVSFKLFKADFPTCYDQNIFFFWTVLI